MISIIIPLYNQTRQLDRCLASIKAQTYDNFEIIIVNDRSTMKMSKVVDKYKRIFGYRFVLLHNQVNHGAPYSRNKGYKFSNGEYVVFCDADVTMRADMLETMHQALLDNRAAAYAYSSFRFGWKKFRSFAFDPELLRLTPYIHTTALLRRKYFPGFDESLKRLQDWDLWLTILENGGSGIWIDSVLFTVETGGTMSSWLPSFSYKLMPWLKTVKKYKLAMEVVKKKHNLTSS